MGTYDSLRGSKNLTNLPALLRALNAPYEEVAGWQSRTVDRTAMWSPQWIVNHHTASKNPVGHESLSWVTNGGLPGVRPPYCHALIGREPKIFLVAAGRANHAGTGGPFKNVPKDSMNPYGYGIEVEAPGLALDFTSGQYDLMCKLNAAVLWILGQPVTHVIRHKDWTDGGVDGVPILPTKGRKVDIRYDLGPVRSLTQSYLNKIDAFGDVTKPVVSLAHIFQAIKKDAPGAQGHTTYKPEVLLVENSLSREGLMDHRYVDGSAGTLSFGNNSAYQKLQLRLGFRGKDADGIPGMKSLTWLGKKYGFNVTL